MLAQARSGNTRPAIGEVRRLVERTRMNDSPGAIFSNAQLLLHAAAAFGIATEHVDEPLRSEWLAERISVLRDAIAAGFNDQKYIEIDPDLKPLGDHAEFSSVFSNSP